MLIAPLFGDHDQTGVEFVPKCALELHKNMTPCTRAAHIWKLASHEKILIDAAYERRVFGRGGDAEFREDTHRHGVRSARLFVRAEGAPGRLRLVGPGVRRLEALGPHERGGEAVKEPLKLREGPGVALRKKDSRDPRRRAAAAERELDARDTMVAKLLERPSDEDARRERKEPCGGRLGLGR